MWHWIDASFSLSSSNQGITNRVNKTLKVEKANILKLSEFHYMNRWIFLKNYNLRNNFTLYTTILEQNKQFKYGVQLIKLFNTYGNRLLDLVLWSENCINRLIRIMKQDFVEIYDLKEQRFYNDTKLENNQQEEENTNSSEKQIKYIPIQILVESFSICQRLFQNGYFVKELASLTLMIYKK